MKKLMLFLVCSGLIQGCSTNQVQSKQATHMNVAAKIMEKPPQPIESGTTCSYNSGGGNSGSCAANQQQLVGAFCSCMTMEGLQNGSIR
jgi:hypothetical protein